MLFFVIRALWSMIIALVPCLNTIGGLSGDAPSDWPSLLGHQGRLNQCGGGSRLTVISVHMLKDATFERGSVGQLKDTDMVRVDKVLDVSPLMPLLRCLSP